MDLLQYIFDAKELRRYERPDGTFMHAEMQIDDSVIMLDNSSDEYPPVQLIIHVYVPYVDEVFKKTISAGCEIVEQPKERDGDPDRRTTFIDFADNI